MGETPNLYASELRTVAVQALAPKLSQAQALTALESLLRRIAETTTTTVDPQEVTVAVQALAPKLSEAQTQAAFAPLLQKIGETTNYDPLRNLFEVVQVLAP